jgi:hypothetical protein
MNHATMTEYITDGDNGRLFSEQFDPLDLTNLAQLGKRTHETAAAGWQHWQNDQSRALEFILRPLQLARRFSLALKLEIKYHTGLYVLKRRLQNLSARHHTVSS